MRDLISGGMRQWLMFKGSVRSSFDCGEHKSPEPRPNLMGYAVLTNQMGSEGGSTLGREPVLRSPRHGWINHHRRFHPGYIIT